MENKQLNVEIKEETAGDFPAVYNVHSTAFGRKEEARLTDRLRLSNAYIPQLSLVAIVEGKVVGHIMFTKIDIVNNENTIQSLSLAPMAVIPTMQGNGIGGQLVRYGLTKAKELGYKSVIVLGHKDYYPRFGFVSTQKWQIKPPFNVPANTFMGLELDENSLSAAAGTVKYADEFVQL